jgi:hypothetical protein
MISAADEPVAVALQAAEWIRIVYAELEEWRTGADAHEAHATENHKFDRVAAELSGELEPHHHRISARAKSALFAIRDHNAPPTRKKLVALQPRYLDPKDIWAALAVIDWWNRALLVRLGRRQRLRSYVTDWTLIKMALLKHMAVRDVAVRVGLDASGSGVAQRIAEATADVAASVGDFALDFPAPRLQWSRPRLTPQIYKSACYNKGKTERQSGT